MNAQNEESENDLNSSGISTGSASIRLPKITLPRFNGDIARFMAFWQSFENAIDKNEGIAAIDKLNYLVNLLEGPAYRAISGLELTGANYANAVQILKTRFGNKQQIISTHMQALLGLQNSPSATVKQLRFIYDNINIHVRGLDALGMSFSSYGSLLVPILMSKMPREVTLQVARKTTEEVWPIDEIMDIVRREIEAMELSDSIRPMEKKFERPSRPKSPQGTTKSFLTKGEKTLSCVFCGQSHMSSSCETVQDVKDRKKVLLDSKRCFSCLKPGHVTKRCWGKGVCYKCGGKFHHESICNKESTPVKEQDTKATSSINMKQEVLLQTASACVYGDDKAKRVEVNILFDGGSQRSYISEEVRRKLNLRVEGQEHLNLNTFGTEKSARKQCDIVKLKLDVGANEPPISISALSYPTICSPINTRVDISMHKHLLGLNLADKRLSEQNRRIDLFVGNDYLYDIIVGDVIRGSSGPVAISSKLGWIISGKTPGSLESTGCNNIYSNLILETSIGQPFVNECHEIKQTLLEFWKHETSGIDGENRKPQALAGQSTEEPFDITFNGQRYQVSLPWKVDVSNLNDDYNLAFKRLKSLHCRLKQNPELFSEYDNIFKDQLANGVIEHVPTTEEDKGTPHFLSHHGVVRRDRETTKLRVVFDGSAKSSKDDLSLNECLELGDNYMPPLFDTLLRFRLHCIAITADIEKTFLQIEIKESDRNALRFLWFDDIRKPYPKVIQFKYCRLVFGLRPSPSILGATIKKHILKFADDCPEVVKILTRLYADDLSCSTNSIETALEIFHKSRDILSQGGFNLRKFRTNDKALLQLIERTNTSTMNPSYAMKEVMQDDLSYAQHTIGPTQKDNNSKVLGVNWDNENDELFFELSQIVELAKMLKPTKRSLLKLAVKIFDPLGCLSVYAINLKALFQELCVEKWGWDEELTGEQRKKYDHFVSEISRVDGIHMPRCLFDKGKKVSKFELHGFSDASEMAYASIVYLRVVYETGEVSIKFVAPKAKVCPITKQSIPRLELLGAQLLAKLVRTVKGVLAEELEGTPINTFYWVDSVAALCWIKNNMVWKQFVRHRVSDILSDSQRNEWFYCPGTQNPADLPSRGMYGPTVERNFFWWEGPGFLKRPPTEWPVQKEDFESKSALVESIKQIPNVARVLASKEISSISNIVEIGRIRTYQKCVHTLAWVFRFINNLRASLANKNFQQGNEISKDEVDNAENVLIRSIQREAFAKEIEYLQTNEETRPPPYVAQFRLFLDEKGILRCQSRLKHASILEQCTKPILLPKCHHVSKLLVIYCHEKVMHDGVRETLNLLRQRYWIPRARELVKGILRKCVTCKRLEGLPFSTTFCPDLPKIRVDDQPPFNNTGLDFAGPLKVLNGINRNGDQKYYVCLFTCMSTRAIHLELVESLEVEAFLRAFRRFTARRGLPSLLLSDNAKSFKSASKEVKCLMRSPRLGETLVRKGVKWQFIVDRSP